MPREATRTTTVTVQGVEIPKLGLGTWQLTGAACERAVAEALALGYRHVDTARMYANEAEVGRAIAAADIAREELFLTTKLLPSALSADGVRRQLDGSLSDLGLDHVDLLLIHWPATDGTPLAETLGAMVDAQQQGAVRHLGVSNFPSAMVREALELAPIVCDQVEYHPYLGQPDLLALARERDLMITAYSPLAQGAVLRDRVIRRIAEAHGRSGAQVVLRWLLDQPQVAAVPKASGHDHLAANLDVFSFELTDDERGAIAGLHRGRRTIDPSFAPDWD
ncbi:MAG: 2,5-diketo-D-gluconate reductase [Solirubrobacteraceae bacterium]|jgi:2,5-diketo-D-gluconate reductase B|nr:2,5-diketo-D-gluconate reductase [Solirubrobacteraceae bacterium]